jgi:acyl carrier protein
MPNDNLAPEISNYIVTQILRQPKRMLKPAEPLLSTGLIDSFHLVDLALFIEDQYNVHLEDTELGVDTFDTVSQLIALIETRLTK